MRVAVKGAFVAFLLLGGCAAGGTAGNMAARHYDSLQQYYAEVGGDILSFFPHSDPAAIRTCYGEAMTRQVPVERQPALLAVVNKMASGVPLTTTDQQLKAKWIDDRPQAEGNILHVNGDNARAAHYEMVMICTPEMMKK